MLVRRNSAPAKRSAPPRRSADEHVASAMNRCGPRGEADRIVAELRDELAATRRMLERETVTAASLDAAVSRAETIAARLPAPEAAEAQLPEPVEARTWKVGDRARSRTGGWEGRIAALEKGGRRATLEAGGLRVTVEVDDLVPAIGTPTSWAGAPGGMAVRLLPRTRRRSVSNAPGPWPRRSTCGAHAWRRRSRPSIATSTMPASPGSGRRPSSMGSGQGALRDAVRTAAAAHPLVRTVRPGERGEGGDGATVVTL